MTATFLETDELRKWLADYLFTEIVCNPNEIDMNLPLNDLGVGSRDAVVLSGQLAELIGLPVSPGGLRAAPHDQRSGEFSRRAAADCYEDGVSSCP